MSIFWEVSKEIKVITKRIQKISQKTIKHSGSKFT